MLDNKQEARDDDGDVDEVTNRFNRTRFNNNNDGGGYYSNRSTRGGRRGGNHRRGNDRRGTQTQGQAANAAPGGMTCKFCVRQHPFGRENCPAWGKRCSACGIPNHFQLSKICKKRTLRNVNEDDDVDEEGDVDFLFLSQVEATATNENDSSADDCSDSDNVDDDMESNDTLSPATEENSITSQRNTLPSTSDDEEEAYYSCNEGEAMIAYICRSETKLTE